MRCSDAVMSAMSYHPGYRSGKTARAYWSFVAEWQSARGDLHHLGGQWVKLELASRFRFGSVRRMLTKSLPLAARRQSKDGSFQSDYPGGSACHVVLAYFRHGMLGRLLGTLRYDPRPFIGSFEHPLGIKTRREVLGAKPQELAEAAGRLSAQIKKKQNRDGSWEGLIVATAGAVHDLLDCGVACEDESVQRGCEWLLSQQRPLDGALFGRAPRLDCEGMIYTARVREEVGYERCCHPEYRWKGSHKECLDLLPTYQTAAALAALCRCGFSRTRAVTRGFEYLMHIRGPGRVKNYTDHWCNCGVRRWLASGVGKFDERR
jgi:hypothetical protein